MKRILTNALIAVVVLALVAGCGGAAKQSVDEQPTAAQSSQAPAAEQPATQPAAKPTDAPAPTQEVAPAEEAEEAEEALTLEDRETGLEQLDSYRARWQGAWTSTQEGKTSEMKWEWTQEYTANPPAQHLRVNSSDSGNPDSASSLEIWRIGEMTYMSGMEGSDEQQCIAITSEDQDPIDQSMFSPNSLGRVEGAKYVGRETVNGVRTKHYKYDEKAANFLGAAKVSGDLWVAEDGGYVVKDSVAWEGNAAGLFSADADAQGQGSWTWEILEVNPKLTITPPEGCESAAADLPVLPDATEKSQFGDMISYKTATPLADAAKFYQEEMVKAGWAAEGETQISEDFGMLNFAKDDQQAQIMLSIEEDKTSVLIMIQK